MPNNIFTEAAKIRKKHPRLEWQECVKRATKQHRAAAKVGAVKKKKKPASAGRQTGSSNRKQDRERTAKAPGRRVAKGSRSVYYERRKNRSDAPGSLTGTAPGPKVKFNYVTKPADKVARITNTVSDLTKLRNQTEANIRSTEAALAWAKRTPNMSAAHRTKNTAMFRKLLTEYGKQLTKYNQMIKTAMKAKQ